MGIATQDTFVQAHPQEMTVEQMDEELKNDHYQEMAFFSVDITASVTRTEVAALTRAFNRRMINRPVVLFIRHDQQLTLSTCERTAYVQKGHQGEKAGKVTMLRNIDCAKPHRGHLEILSGLNLSGCTSFDELYKQWFNTFSNELLTKKFYAELSDWYAWAVQIVRFPNDLNTTEDDSRFNQESCIRLITRLIFVWFLKQKHLIPDEFFDERYIHDNLIEDFDPHCRKSLHYDAEQSRYYRLILQNLFFAMLNCPIVAEGKSTPNNRRFRKVVSSSRNSDYNVNYLMRYESEFREGGAQLFVKLANSTVPFLNGGLFDCLDDKPRRMYYDGFSERKESLEQLYLPDYLFFSDEMGRNIDLSQWYGDSNKRSVSARGLIDILKRYSFTIEENTPLDQEVSLDPELLGKVFENLLASYNPETQTSARKQTGSFYTPREIVQYMVDESLVAHLKRVCGEDKEQIYRDLMSYSVDAEGLDADLCKDIMDAIYNCRVLDPACGSGAFPMGVLQQMVHILQQIDPTNEMWREFMINRAIQLSEEAYKNEDNTEDRRARLADIEEAFDRQINDPDYARKLYLIEHCIYGVDIQPIATQISKLRFFISLVVDQKPTNNAKENFGIRPLPNLEAKFVTANTLIPLDRSKDLFSSSDEIRSYEEQLRAINHRIFLAKRNKEKVELQRNMIDTRRNMAQAMQNLGFIGDNGYYQLVGWNMFDQNASAPFFDPEWMFGINDGFDIVIGNPPYINVKRGIDPALKRLYESSFSTAVGQYDLFVLFIELGLKYGSICCMIVPRPLLNNENYMTARSLMLASSIQQIVIGSNIFENAGVESCIFLTDRFNNNSRVQISRYEYGVFKKYYLIDTKLYRQSKKLVFSTELDDSVADLIGNLNKFPKLSDLFNVKRGVETGKRDDSIIDYDNGYALLRGEDISKYVIHHAGKYIVFDGSNVSKYKELSLYKNPKILLRRVCNTIQCVFDNEAYIVLNTIYCLTLKDSSVEFLEAYSGVLNSKLVDFWFFRTYCNTDKLFPYIRVSQLKEIPLPYLKRNVAHSLQRLVKSVKGFKEAREARNKIDLIVFKLYKLTYDEVLIIDPETPITREEYDAFNVEEEANG